MNEINKLNSRSRKQTSSMLENGFGDRVKRRLRSFGVGWLIGTSRSVR